MVVEPLVDVDDVVEGVDVAVVLLVLAVDVLGINHGAFSERTGDIGA